MNLLPLARFQLHSVTTESNVIELIDSTPCCVHITSSLDHNHKPCTDLTLYFEISTGTKIDSVEMHSNMGAQFNLTLEGARRKVVLDSLVVVPCKTTSFYALRLKVVADERRSKSVWQWFKSIWSTPGYGSNNLVEYYS